MVVGYCNGNTIIINRGRGEGRMRTGDYMVMAPEAAAISPPHLLKTCMR